MKASLTLMTINVLYIIIFNIKVVLFNIHPKIETWYLTTGVSFVFFAVALYAKKSENDEDGFISML